MTTLINKESTQHYANKMVLAENRKVGSKSLPTALNEIDALIDEMKTYFDVEYGSALDMKLENNKNVFSVGTGTNIDKRSEVENSFTDVELSGNSLVNLFTTTQNFVAAGNNIARNGFVITLSNTSGWAKIGNRLSLKPNTTYYVQITCENKSDTVCGSYIRFSHDINYSTGTNIPQFPANSTTTQSKVFTTDDTGLVLLSVERGQGTNKSIFYDIILLEGNWTNKPIPQYFEGLKSIGEKEDENHKISISSIKKNLLKLNLNSFEYNGIRGTRSGDKLILNGTCTERFTARLTPNKFNGAGNPFNLEKNSTYTLSSNYTKGRVNVMQYDTWNITLSKRETATSLTGIIPPAACDNLFAYIIIEEGFSFNNEEFWFMLEKTDSFTSYEPYKEDKKEITLNEPLRRIPNGVKDTIEKINGQWKIIRRCKEALLNGKEYWHYSGDHTSNEDYKCFHAQVSTEYKIGVDAKGLCDKFPIAIVTPATAFKEGIQPSANYNVFYVKVKADKVEGTNDANIFRTWVTNNPIRVIYQLATPIIEDINTITLQCWKNGVISIDDVLPVETNHTVALNKSAQIKNNIEELTTLRKRVETLESFYDKIALEQAYQLDLVNHSYELDYNR